MTSQTNAATNAAPNAAPNAGCPRGETNAEPTPPTPDDHKTAGHANAGSTPSNAAPSQRRFPPSLYRGGKRGATQEVALRHARGTSEWSACGLAISDVFIDSDDTDCTVCRRLPVNAARLALDIPDPAELRAIAAAALRAAADLETDPRTKEATP